MRIDEVVGDMRRTGELLPQVPSPVPLKAPRWGTRSTDREVMDLEAEAGQSLPTDYRTFLLQYGAVQAMDVFNGYDIFGAQQALAMTQKGDGPRHIDTGSGTVPVVTIGGDGGGNLYLLVPGSGGVFKWLHEYGVENERVAEGRALERLASDFTTFLGRVAEDWKHFVADDRSWKYVSG